MGYCFFEKLLTFPGSCFHVLMCSWFIARSWVQLQFNKEQFGCFVGCGDASCAALPGGEREKGLGVKERTTRVPHRLKRC